MNYIKNRIRKKIISLTFLMLYGLCINGQVVNPVKDNHISDESQKTGDVHTVDNPSVKTTNPNATQRTRDLLVYFYTISAKKENKVISGQFTGTKGGNIYKPDDLNNLFAQTNQWPGMIGIDYCDYGRSNDTTRMFNPPNYKKANPALIDYWKKGGLVTIDVHLGNPQTGFNCNSYKADIPELLKEGGKGHDVYISWLDIIAEGLKELQDSGVVVLWRPFHERFWWGNIPTYYPELWQHMFNYFTYTKKLNNLLWVYAPEGTRVPHPIEKYPGDEYVDIVAFDLYSTDHVFPLPEDHPSHTIYDFLIKTGKPFILGEIGVQHKKGDWHKRGTWDTTEIIKAIKVYYPKAVAFQAWGGRFSLSGNLKAKQLLDDPLVLTRDEISF